MNIIRILTIVLVLTILNSIFTIALKSENIVNLESEGDGDGTPDCEDSDDCSTSTTNPKCDNGVCVGCVLGDDDVCSKFPGFPWCRDDGRCVECLTTSDCTGDDVCYQDSNICDPCRNNNDCPTGKTCNNLRKCVDVTVINCSNDEPCIQLGLECRSGICQVELPIAPTQEGIPEEQPFPVFNFYNIIISILILFGYYIRKIYR